MATRTMTHGDSAVRTYRNVAAVLGVLLVATVGARWLALGPLTVVVAMGIATAKAILVALYFMHLREANWAQRVFAGVGVLWLGILIFLTLSDYVHRV